MNQCTQSSLTEAAQLLVIDADSRLLYAQMREVIDLVQRGLPVQLVGPAADLNPIVRLAIEDESRYMEIMEMIDSKRIEIDLPALSNQDISRRAYMREFMHIRRARLRRLVDLSNDLRSEDNKIQGDSRKEFENTHAARWKAEKDRREDALRVRSGRRLTAGERKNIQTEFWEDVDAELNELQGFVRAQLRKPLQRRDPNGFSFRIGMTS